MKWVVLATAPDQLTAEMWLELITQSGVQCHIRPGDTTGFLGISAHPVRIVTREEDVDRARRLLQQGIGQDSENTIP